MADQDQKGTPGKPVLGSVTPAPAPGSPAVPPKPTGSTGKYAPIGSKPAGPSSTGKFSPARSGGNFAPPGNSVPIGSGGIAGTGKHAPVGNANKFAPTTGQAAGASPPKFSPAGARPQNSAPEASRPRVNPPPGASSARLSVNQSLQTGGKKTTGQWMCSSCGMALGPQSVMLGTGIILDGKLICVSCVKSGKRRVQSTIPAHLIWSITGGIVAILGIAALFIPGQVLLTVLLLSVCAILTGLIGFTLSWVGRLSAIAAGLLIGACAVYGLIAIRERTQEQIGNVELKVEGDRIKDYLDHDAINEAIRQLRALDENSKRADSKFSSPGCLKELQKLRALTKEWTVKNFGQLTNEEETLLFTLFRKFGSLTGSSRTFRAIKISDNTVDLSMAVDTSGDSPNGRGGPSSDPVGAKGLPVAKSIIDNVRNVERIDLKLVSVTSAETKELESVVLDAQAIKDLKDGDLNAYNMALPTYSGPKPVKAPVPTPVPKNGSTVPPTNLPDLGPPPGMKSDRQPQNR